MCAWISPSVWSELFRQQRARDVARLDRLVQRREPAALSLNGSSISAGSGTPDRLHGDEALYQCLAVGVGLDALRLR